MGIRMPGIGSGIDPKLIDQLVEVQKMPVEAAKKRREETQSVKQEFSKLDGLLTKLDSSLNGLKSRSDFFKLKLNSSHPDILDGSVTPTALLGTYEFEVRGLAKAEKELAYGFPDKDQTPVGFGYMMIEREDKDPLEVVVEPNSTLQDVAQQINDSDAGVRAMVVNTKYKPESYRLLVISEKSGNEAKIHIDEDTTFLEFKEQVSGRNLDVLFEDVPITDEDNTMDELLDGVVLQAKRSEPGTRVQVNITHDVDKTLEGIKAFVDSYNEIARYIHDQFKYNDEAKKAGKLSGDGSIKTILRGMQSALGNSISSSGKYRTLADIGITTNPKEGTLNMDETKVRQALDDNYEAVARLFIRTKDGSGVADRLGQQIKAFRDPQSGTLKSRMRGLDNVIKNQDQDIERRERQLEQQEETIRRRFMSLENRMSDLKSQGDFLSAKLQAPQGGGG